MDITQDGARGPVYTRDMDGAAEWRMLGSMAEHPASTPGCTLNLHHLHSSEKLTHRDLHSGAGEDCLFPKGHHDIASWPFQKLNLGPSGYRTVSGNARPTRLLLGNECPEGSEWYGWVCDQLLLLIRYEQQICVINKKQPSHPTGAGQTNRRTYEAI